MTCLVYLLDVYGCLRSISQISVQRFSQSTKPFPAVGSSLYVRLYVQLVLGPHPLTPAHRPSAGIPKTGEGELYSWMVWCSLSALTVTSSPLHLFTFLIPFTRSMMYNESRKRCCYISASSASSAVKDFDLFIRVYLRLFATSAFDFIPFIPFIPANLPCRGE
jgi:hypothetical protein